VQKKGHPNKFPSSHAKRNNQMIPLWWVVRIIATGGRMQENFLPLFALSSLSSTFLELAPTWYSPPLQLAYQIRQKNYPKNLLTLKKNKRPSKEQNSKTRGEAPKGIPCRKPSGRVFEAAKICRICPIVPHHSLSRPANLVVDWTPSVVAENCLFNSIRLNPNAR